MTTKKISSKHILTQTVATFDYVPPESDVDYPSEWFAKNPQSKPVIAVPVTSATWEGLVSSVKGGIQSGDLTISTAKIYLAEYANKISSNIDTNWTSFNIHIASQGDELTPWALAIRIAGKDHSPTEKGIQALAQGTDPGRDHPINWTERSLTLYILCIYRLLKITNDEYKSLLEKRMLDQLGAEGGAGMTFSGCESSYGSWLSDKHFLKLVAIYDMFFYRFRDHEQAILRLGSLGSRFRDCATMLSFGYAMAMLNIDSGDLMEWVFIRTMGHDLLRITKPGQETGDKYSYFLYQSDLGLITKSAYSSNSNPYLFHWIHLLGSLLGHTRSENARFNFEGGFSDLGLNAVLVAWVLGRGGELNPQFSGEGTDYGKEISIIEDGDGGYELTADDKAWIETTGRNPKVWFAILKNSKFNPPRVVRRTISTMREKLTGARDGTVGSYVRDKLIF